MVNKIVIKEELTQELKGVFMKLQVDHRELLPGIYGLYNELSVFGKCESYSLERIYYVAYTLASKGIEFTVEV